MPDTATADSTKPKSVNKVEITDAGPSLKKLSIGPKQGDGTHYQGPVDVQMRLRRRQTENSIDLPCCSGRRCTIGCKPFDPNRVEAYQ